MENCTPDAVLSLVEDEVEELNKTFSTVTPYMTCKFPLGGKLSINAGFAYDRVQLLGLIVDNANIPPRFVPLYESEEMGMPVDVRAGNHDDEMGTMLGGCDEGEGGC